MIPIACIDVGSGALRMEIAETNGVEMRILDSLRLPSMLGRDVYAMGRVGYDTLHSTCETLSRFTRLLSEYEISQDHYRVVATSAIRESENRDYIIDQIFINTGLRPIIITNAEERFTIYSCLWDTMPEYRQMREEGLVIVDIGYGSIQITTLQKGEMMFSRNIRLGALRLHELLGSVASKSLRFSDMLAEYIMASTDHLKSLEHWKEFPHCIVLTGEADVLSMLCEKTSRGFTTVGESAVGGGISGVTGIPTLHVGVKDYRVTKGVFNRVFAVLKRRNNTELQRITGVDRLRAEMLLPTVLIITALSDMTSADAIHMPNLSLGDGVLHKLRLELFPDVVHEDNNADIVSLARELAKSYQYDKNHADTVERKALFLFDSLKALHGLGERERLLLQLAGILHDTGKYISSINHGHRVSDLVLASELIGLSRNELHMLAIVCRYHSGRPPKLEQGDFMGLHHGNRIIAAKLTAVLRLADALDKSHTGRLELIAADICEDGLILTAVSGYDPLLEKWMFELKADYFREVFGIEAVLKVKIM